MIDSIYIISYFLIGAMLSLSLLGLILAVVMSFNDRWSKRFFIVLFFILALCWISYFLDLFYMDDPSMVLAERIVAFFEGLLLSLPILMFPFFLLHSCGEKIKGSVLSRAALILWSAYFVMLVTAQFTDLFYHIAPGKPLTLGEWYPLAMAVLLTILILNLIGTIRRWKKLSGKYFCAFLFFLLPLTVALLIHIFFTNFMIVDTAVIISVLSMFFIILSDQRDQQIRQQQEIARQQASIMVLQMRPHFIYNTMTSIYYLCEQDPEKAQKVTLDFTAYLRRNFTAIASEDTIPFSDELEHARAYLDVEQASYDDRLVVEFDTPHTHFRVPPLTLQPIVENAVKYGMDPDGDPLHITIRTRETDAGSEIIVEDNGPGYEPADNKEPHIALTNIRQRLEMMCGGKMVIMPREGGGTVVKVMIPY